jgi:ABC-2 type transport system permease protein
LTYLPVLLDLSFPVDSVEFWLLVGGAFGVILAVLVGAFSTGVLRWLALFIFCNGCAAIGVGIWKATQETATLEAGIDPMSVLSSYLGLVLVGAMFLSLGLFISSLVRSQMVAALVSMFASLAFLVAGFWRPPMDLGGTPYQIVLFFTVPLHFERFFSRGLVDTRQLVLYGSVALFCLFMTVRSLESRRWR